MWLLFNEQRIKLNIYIIPHWRNRTRIISNAQRICRPA